MSWLWPQSKIGWVLYLFLFGGLFLWLVCLAGQTGILDDMRAEYAASQAMDLIAQQTIYKTNEHMLAHAESASIISCLNKKGPAIKFKSSTEKNKFYLMCQIDEGQWAGKWGIAEFIENMRKPDPVTAFIREDGSITKTFNYLMKWGTKFTKALPWE